jgi:hypothetical protein
LGSRKGAIRIYTKRGHGTAIYTAASAIEDARIRDKEIWIKFKDQEKGDWFARRLPREGHGVLGVWDPNED